MPNILEQALPELSTLAGHTISDVKDLASLLQTAKARQKGSEIVAQIQKDLTDRLTEAQEQMSAMRKELTAQNEETRQMLAEQSNMKTLLANATPEQRVEIIKSAMKEYGVAATEYALTPDKVEKSLKGRFQRGTEQAVVADKFRKINDTLHTALAIKKSLSYNDEDVSINVPRLKKILELMRGYEMEGVDEYEAYLQQKGVAAYDTTTNYEGKDFIPTYLSQNVIDMIWLPLRIAASIPRIQMLSPTFEMPQITSRGRAYLMAQATEDSDLFTDKTTKDQFQTAKFSFTAQKLASSASFSDEIRDDSLIPFVSLVLSKVVEAQQVALEDQCVNGNRSNYNGALDNADSGNKLWSSTADARYLADGIRYAVGSNQKVSGLNAEPTLAYLRKVRRTLGKYGVNPDELLWAFNPVTMAGLLSIDEVLRWRDIRDRATVMTGVLNEIDGIGVLYSEFIYNNLNASGVYDGTTTSRTMGLLFRPSGYMYGDLRTARIEQDRQITSQQTTVVLSQRLDYKKVRASTVPEAAILYNIPG